MQILVLNNQKGGVGKSAIACQLALYLALKRGRRVLVIDIDHQGNSTETLRQSEHFAVAAFSSSKLFLEASVTFDDAPCLLVPADRLLLSLESQPTRHDEFLNNFVGNIRAKLPFDLAIIDTGPNPDIRPTSALIAANYVLAPIQLNQEAIDGLASFRADVDRVRPLNSEIKILGAIPNIVQKTPFQAENLKAVYEHFPTLFLRLNDGKPACIMLRQAIAEAQASGKSVFEIKKAKDVWREVEPVFARIAELMAIGEITQEEVEA